MARTLFWERLLNAITGGGHSANIRPDLTANLRELIVYVHFAAGVTAGTFVVEAAHDPDFTGTWSNVGTIAWAAADSVKHLAVSGTHRAIRVRESVAVANGNASVYATGN